MKYLIILLPFLLAFNSCNNEPLAVKDTLSEVISEEFKRRCIVTPSCKIDQIPSDDNCSCVSCLDKFDYVLIETFGCVKLSPLELELKKRAKQLFQYK